MKPVAPVRAIRGLAPTGFTAGLGRSMGLSHQYTAFGRCGLRSPAAVLLQPAMALRRRSASAGPVSLQPGCACDALPLGQIIADESGKFLRAAPRQVGTLLCQRGDDVGRVRRLVRGGPEAIDDLAPRARR